MTREEAIRIIRETYHTDEEMNALESLIPELRESEDERVAKAIDEIMKLSRTWGIAARYGFTAGDIRRWVKKQKEQKPAEWSEEDDATIKSAVHWLEKYLSTIKAKDVSSATQDGILTVKVTITNLKSLRPCPSWKPSEEHLSALLAIFNDPDNIGSQTCQLALSDLYEQLKKL